MRGEGGFGGGGSRGTSQRKEVISNVCTGIYRVKHLYIYFG